MLFCWILVGLVNKLANVIVKTPWIDTFSCGKAGRGGGGEGDGEEDSDVMQG